MPPEINELAVDLSTAGAVATQSATTAPVTSDPLDTTLDIESSWADDQDDPSTDTTPESTTDAKPAASHDATKLSYRANGKDVEVTVEEAKRRLAMHDGSRKAFAERDQARKELERVQGELKTAAAAQDTWAKLEAIRHDDKQLYKVITGRDFDDVINKEIERRNAYATATPEQRTQLDFMREVQVEREHRAREKVESERRLAQTTQLREDAEKRNMQTTLEHTFRPFSFTGKVADPAKANRLNEMVWKTAVTNLEVQARNKVEITPEVMKAEFRACFEAVNGTLDTQTRERVQQAATTRKAEAKANVQVAARRGIEDASTIGEEIRKHAGSPSELLKVFQRHARRGR